MTNLTSPEHRLNPVPYYAEMRRTQPVTYLEDLGVWMLYRYEDVRFALSAHEVILDPGAVASVEPVAGLIVHGVRRLRVRFRAGRRLASR